MSGSESPRITSLEPGQVARLLSAAGQRSIDESMIRADIESGAPVNADGTLNLVHYTAWLVKQAAARGQEEGGDT